MSLTINGSTTLIEVASGPQGPAGLGVPVGGSTGQVLTKNSGTDFDTGWSTVSGGSSNLDGLSDVVITSPAAAQVLRYSGTQWVNSTLAFADLSGKPTTLAGYGITDAASVGHSHTLDGLSDVVITGLPVDRSVLLYDDATARWVNSLVNFSDVSGTPTTLAGYGITDAAALSHVHSGADITSGTVAVARLGSGTANSGKYLRGDGSWQDLIDQLALLTDVDTSSVVNNSFLRFSTGAGSLWVASSPTTLAGFGITDAVISSRQVIAGTGLTGGGDLSADRTLTVAYGSTSTTACAGNDARLSDARTPLSHTHAATDINSGTLDAARLATNQKISTVGCVFNGGAGTPALGDVEVSVPFAGTITKARIVADATGSAVVDVEKSTYSGYPSMSSIAASAKPTLSSASKSEDSTLTGWTTSVAAGDIIKFQLESVTTCKRVMVSLEIVRT